MALMVVPLWGKYRLSRGWGPCFLFFRVPRAGGDPDLSQRGIGLAGISFSRRRGAGGKAHAPRSSHRQKVVGTLPVCAKGSGSPPSRGTRDLWLLNPHLSRVILRRETPKQPRGSSLQDRVSPLGCFAALAMTRRRGSECPHIRVPREGGDLVRRFQAVSFVLGPRLRGEHGTCGF